MSARTYPLVFYNLDNNRDPKQVEREVRGILTGWRPAILGLCECNGYPKWGVEDYVLIVDESKPGRANLRAYVKASINRDPEKWHDCKQTWSRTNPGASGQHWPRSILEFRAGRLQVLIAHQPPKGTDNVKKSQKEGTDKLTARMAPWSRDDWAARTDDDKATAKTQARLVLWDANRRTGEGDYGPDTLTRAISGYAVNQRIDGCVYRGGTCANITYPTKTNDGTTLKSDHKHAFRCEVTVP